MYICLHLACSCMHALDIQYASCGHTSYSFCEVLETSSKLDFIRTLCTTTTAPTTVLLLLNWFCFPFISWAELSITKKLKGNQSQKYLSYRISSQSCNFSSTITKTNFLPRNIKDGVIPGFISYSLPLMSEHLVIDHRWSVRYHRCPYHPDRQINPFRLMSRSPQGFSSSSSACFSWSAAFQGSQTSCLQPKCWKSEESHTGNHFNLYDNFESLIRDLVYRSSSVARKCQIGLWFNLHDTVEEMYPKVHCSYLLWVALHGINDAFKVIKT